MHRSVAPVVLLIFSSLLTACARRADIEVSAAFTRATPPGAPMGVLYMDLTNHSRQPDRLLAVRTTAAGRVEIHATSMMEGMMQMRPVAELELPAGERTQFSPEGLHLMLVDLSQPLREGQSISVTLRFGRAPEQTLQVPVLALGATAHSH